MLGVTALQVAAGIGWVEGITYEWSPKATLEAVKMLLDLGLDPNAQADTGRTALHGAAHKGRADVIQMLADHGAKLDVRDYGNTDNRGGKLAVHTWQPVDYADGLVRVGVQSAIAHPEAGLLLRKLMTGQGPAGAADGPHARVDLHHRRLRLTPGVTGGSGGRGGFQRGDRRDRWGWPATDFQLVRCMVRGGPALRRPSAGGPPYASPARGHQLSGLCDPCVENLRELHSGLPPRRSPLESSVARISIPLDYRQELSYALVGNQWEHAMSKPTDLVQGTLDLLILKVIALEPMHGWAIAQRISQMSNDVLLVGQGSLYPALHKLEQQGWIEAEWGESDNNRRAKYYTITREGRRALKEEAAQWERLSAAISGIVRLA